MLSTHSSWTHVTLNHVFATHHNKYWEPMILPVTDEYMNEI